MSSTKSLKDMLAQAARVQSAVAKKAPADSPRPATPVAVHAPAIASAPPARWVSVSKLSPDTPGLASHGAEGTAVLDAPPAVAGVPANAPPFATDGAPRVDISFALRETTAAPRSDERMADDTLAAATAYAGLPLIDGTIPDDVDAVLRSLTANFADIAAAFPPGQTLGEVDDVPFEAPRPERPEDVIELDDEPAAPALVPDIADLKVFLQPQGQGEHRTLESLLTHMANVRATDLSLSIGEPPAYRIGHEYQRIDHLPLTALHLNSMLYAILTPEDMKRIEMLSARADQAVQMVGSDVMHEIDVVYEYNGNRYRCNVAMEERGPMLSIRQLPKTPPRFINLGLPSAVEESFALASGLILFAGPTGAGKSTTMAAIVDEIARREAGRIITIEEPIEYRYPRNLRSIVTQREVGRHTHSFASGVKAALRQDPDILVIGELLDAETMERALAVARTGHLVLGTIHANSAAHVPQRVVDMFPASVRPVIASQLAGVLELIVFQQRLPRIRGGLIPAFEVVPVPSGAVRANIDEMNFVELKQSCKESARRNGGVTLFESVVALSQRSEVEARIAMSVLSAEDREQYEREMVL